MTSQSNEILRWPQPGAVSPEFPSPEAAVEFMARTVGLTVDDINLTPASQISSDELPISASAWFPGIPATGLFYNPGGSSESYRLTEGATGIARKVQEGSLTPEQLATQKQSVRTPKDHAIFDLLPRQTDRSEEDPDSQIRTVATTMRHKGITAVLINGTLEDERRYEGISLTERTGAELADLTFVEGRALPIPSHELERRLETPGLITDIIRPLQRAVLTAYREGADLLDERFDLLPGFSD